MSDITVHHGDSRAVLPTLVEASFDSVVCDPPYSLVSIQKRFGKPGSAPAQEGRDGLYRRASAGFMGKQWDTGDTAFDPAFWAEVMRVMKPGAHLIAFGGTRTYHRLACAVEDAGFEIRDQVGWLYGSGFPKSHNIGDGWGTALKPAWEPIVLARKPFKGTVAGNVLEHGTGALNIDGCRIPKDADDRHEYGVSGDEPSMAGGGVALGNMGRVEYAPHEGGRWPANVIHDGSPEVVGAFPADRPGCKGPPSEVKARGEVFKGERGQGPLYADDGTAARFFYSAKADAEDRLGSKHPTVKPVDLMAYLCRLVTPPGGTVLDPFAGSGTTGMACLREGFNAVLIEREAEYCGDIERRLRHVRGEDTPLFGGAA